jgi:fructokinase
MRIGIDLGGAKIESVTLGNDGAELARLRVPTPKNDYHGIVAALVGLVAALEAKAGAETNYARAVSSLAATPQAPRLATR